MAKLALLKSDNSTVYAGRRANHFNLEFYKVVGSSFVGSISVQQIIPHGEGWLVLYTHRYLSVHTKKAVTSYRAASVRENESGRLYCTSDIIVS